MELKNRLIQFIQYKQMTIKAFEERCEMSNGYISSMRKGLGVNKLNNVLTQFPELNREWLLYGEGTMLRTDATSESREEAEMEATDLVRELRRQLEEERRKNEELQKKTDAQQSTINSMAKTMEMMMEEKQKSICG